MKAGFLCAAFVLLVAAGCLAPSAPQTLPAEDAATPAPPVMLGFASERMRLSDPRARMSEFTVAQDPTNPSRIVVIAMNSDDPNGGRTCNVFESLDSGRSWADITPAPFLDWGIAFDPWGVIDRSGRLHMVCVETQTGGTAYLRLENGTWTDPAHVPGSGSDKPAIGIDSQDGLHVCSSAGTPLAYQRSLDHGASWEEGSLPGMRGLCDGVYGGPDGRIHVVWEPEDTFPRRVPIYVSTSVDGGNTWGPDVEAGVMMTHFGANPACDPLRDVYEFAYAACALTDMAIRPDHPTFMSPQIAVSPVTGTVLVAYQNYTEEGRYEVVLSRSTDGGGSFQRLATLPEGASTCDGCHLSRPVPAFDPLGRMGLLWKRGDGVQGYEVRLSVSTDEGDTWSPPVIVGRSELTTNPWHPGALAPNPQYLANGAREFVTDGPDADSAVAYVGSSLFLSLVDAANGDGAHYWAMATTGDTFIPMWIDGHDGGVPQLWARIVCTTAC